MSEGFMVTGGGLQYLAIVSTATTNKYISITMDKLENLETFDPKYEEKRRKIVIDGLNDLRRSLMQEIVGDIEPERNFDNGRPYSQPTKMDK